jgi:hypothetical protein
LLGFVGVTLSLTRHATLIGLERAHLPRFHQRPTFIRCRLARISGLEVRLM